MSLLKSNYNYLETDGLALKYKVEIVADCRGNGSEMLDY